MNREEYIKQALERVKQQKTKCMGCFAPRQTLTTKTHIEKVWTPDEIRSHNEGVMVKCHYCKQWRLLELNKVSRPNFYMDVSAGYTMFMLIKDEQFKALVGVGEPGDLPLRLQEWMDQVNS